jgi:hypothetical protein
MWPFAVRSPLTSDDEGWQLDTWRFLLKELGGLEDLRAVPLVLPTKEFFPATDAQGHARAERVFATVKELMGLEQWHCRLVAQPENPDSRVSEAAYLKFDDKNWNPGGSFGLEGNEIIITYSPGLIDDPVGLVATFAHELSHYLLSTKSEPPGGWGNHEFCTDLCVVYTGFGLFGAATAFRYFSGGQSWGYQRSGYLGQSEWTFALAVFFALRDQPIEEATPWLPSHLMRGVRRSAKYLAKHPAKIEALRSGATAR